MAEKLVAKMIGRETSGSSDSVRTCPMPGWPEFAPDEIAAATAVLRSGKVNYWTGDEGKEFEKEFSEHLGVRFSVAVANGTVAIELALQALGIGDGHEVVVTPRTFIASASPVVLRGARPVFADVDPDSGTITAETIQRVLSPRTRAIIPVHLAGWPCDMEAIVALAREHDLKVIEDCAQAHGATWNGRPVGSFGHVSAFSFCQDKIMTTAGEGGLIATNDERLWSEAWSFKDHGKSYEAVHHREHPPGFRWLHESFGTNWRLTEIQSAIGRIQLRKLPVWTGLRRRNAAILTERLGRIPALRVPMPPAQGGHAFYKFYCYVRPGLLREGWSRDRIIAETSRQGIPAFSGSCSEVYLEKAFEKTGLGPRERLSVARDLGETSLMFLVHPTLGVEDMNNTAVAVEKVMARASK